METFATSKNGRIPMKKTLFSSLLSLSAGIFLFTAAAQADVLKIKPTHPDRYTVVKGDTLWDISGRFLEHPWAVARNLADQSTNRRSSLDLSR